MIRDKIGIIEDQYENKIQEDKKRVNRFTAERMARQNKDKLHERLEDLRKFYVYIKENL